MDEFDELLKMLKEKGYRVTDHSRGARTAGEMFSSKKTVMAARAFLTFDTAPNDALKRIRDEAHWYLWIDDDGCTLRAGHQDRNYETQTEYPSLTELVISDAENCLRRSFSPTERKLVTRTGENEWSISEPLFTELRQMEQAPVAANYDFPKHVRKAFGLP